MKNDGPSVQKVKDTPTITPSGSVMLAFGAHRGRSAKLARKKRETRISIGEISWSIPIINVFFVKIRSSFCFKSHYNLLQTFNALK